MIDNLKKKIISYIYVISKQPVSNNKFTIDISAQAKGIYFVKVESDKPIFKKFRLYW